MAKPQIEKIIDTGKIDLNIKKLSDRAKLPELGINDSADLYSLKRYTIASNNITSVETGLSFDIPSGYLGILEEDKDFALENGLVIKTRIVYSGDKELRVLMQNASDYPVTLEVGTKIAQLIIFKLPKTNWNEVRKQTPQEDLKAEPKPTE